MSNGNAISVKSRSTGGVRCCGRCFCSGVFSFSVCYVGSETGHRTGAGTVQINNLMNHEVLNTANEDRVHMVVDVLEKPAPERRVLQPGQRCHYVVNADQPNNPGC